jgi:hypothetical protein
LRCPVVIKSSNTHMYLHKQFFGLEDKTRIYSRERVTQMNCVPLENIGTSEQIL